MRARDLLAPFPTVDLDTPVLDAARLLANQDLPRLVVVDETGAPISILPGPEVLRLAVSRTRSPLVAVTEDGRLLCAVTLQALLDRVLTA